MKLQQTFTVEITDDDILDIINSEQEDSNLEPFKTFEEIPEQLIFHYLNESFYFSNIFYDNYEYDVNQIEILK